MSGIDFNKTYKREDFLNFFQNEFLPEDFQISEEEIDLNFQAKYIKNVTKLGECPDLRLKVYEITHESDKDPRVSLTKEAFRLMKIYNDFYVIAIFKSQNSDNFRLSYLTIGIKPEDKKIEYKYSNPRRYSFFLGHDAQVHTPEAYLIKKGRIKSFDDLQERFSIEVVNKEFYRKIAHLFTKLVGGKRKEGNKTNEYDAILKLPSCNDHKKMQEFAVRLIGRIMFCWFLKKKTTPNQKLIISGEILSFGAVKTSKNYYHSILEKLFFQVLNKPLEKRRKEFQIGLFSEIPFLNGGLFEPQDDDFYDIDESTGYSKYINTLEVPDSWFEELLDLLRTYNFTIDESTPIDIELSIDPEMLGRIFENLLAEINPETGETVRKSTGSYYTPRPIVEYMVDESLKQYLITKTEIKEQKLQKLLSYYSEEEDYLSNKEKDQIIDALDKVKIIDPACGSSAFPIGVLQKMVLILQKVDPDSMNWLIKQLDRIPDTYVRKMVEDQLMKEDWDYIRKLGIIQNSIYGVDIQEIAVEISKLRVFLSLIVDAKVDENEDNLGIKPLPNLEFKFVCANSLIGLPEKSGELFEDRGGINKLKNLRDRYFSSYGYEKHKIEKEFKETQNEMFKKGIENRATGSRTTLLSSWNPFSYKQSDWFDPEWMFGIKQGFDIVIANPPYVQIQKYSGKQEQKNWENQNFSTFTRTGDIYCLFYEKGNILLKENSILTFISSNKWMRANYGKYIRKYFNKNTNPLILVDFGGYKVFKSAIVDTNILIFRKSENSYKTLGCTIKDDFTKNTNIFNYVNNHGVILSNLSSEGWIIMKKEEQRIKEKIEKIGTPLKDWDISIYRGILTGYNEAFIIDGKKKNELIAADPKNAEIIKPILRGRDIKRYKADFADLWLINTHNGYKTKNEKQVLPIDVEHDYPFIKEHLDEYWEKIKKRQDQGITPYNLRNCAYLEEFEKEKIAFPVINRKWGFPYVGKGVIILAPMKFITAKNSLMFIRSIFRSKIIQYYWKIVGNMQDRNGFQMDNYVVGKIPIPQIPTEKQKPFEELVDIILEKKEKGEDTNEEEQKINQMVYKLYELTPEEIEIVEGETMDKSQKQISENLNDDSKMKSNKKEEIICPNCGTPMVFKKGDLSDFYYCQKCKKTIVVSMISKYKNK